MRSWPGIIQINLLQTFSADGRLTGPENPETLTDSRIRFVHYPDCQQLQIWLPVAGAEYDRILLTPEGQSEPLEDWKVSEKLSGSIQILWDTLTISPGNYQIRITKKTGSYHLIGIQKFREDESPDSEPVAGTVTDPESEKPPIVYRDGLGNILPNEDLELREKAIEDLVAKFSRRLEYISEGRGGIIYYLEGDIRLPFYYELGGGDCVAYIDIPEPDRWTRSTGLSLDRRKDIISFLAMQAHADQAPSCRVSITDREISFHNK